MTRSLSAEGDDDQLQGINSTHGDRTDISIPFDKESSSKTATKTIAVSTYQDSSASKHNRYPPLIFAHGASGSMHTPAVAHLLEGVTSHREGITFQGNMNLKGRVRQFKAVAEWCENRQKEAKGAHSKVAGGPVLGGRSMGARAAVIAATELTSNTDEANTTPREDAIDVELTKQLVLVSYPLVSPKEELRDQILLELDDSFEVLFIIGTRDAMCPLEQLEEVRHKMHAKTWLVRVVDADHGMALRGGAKIDVSSVIRKTGHVTTTWLQDRPLGKTEARIWWGKRDAEEGDENAQWSDWQVSAVKQTSAGQVELAEDNHVAVDNAGAEHPKAKTRQKSSSVPSGKSTKRKHKSTDDVVRKAIEKSGAKDSIGDGPASRTRKRTKT